MHISDPMALPDTVLLQILFFNCLNGAGYSRFTSGSLEQTITLLMSHLYPTNLKAEIHKRPNMNKPLRKDIRKFIAKLTPESVQCQAYSVRKQHYIDITDEEKTKMIKNTHFAHGSHTAKKKLAIKWLPVLIVSKTKRRNC